MAIPTPDYGPDSIFWQISYHFDDAADGIQGAGEWLNRIPIIGSGIGIYFYNASYCLRRIRDGLRTVGNIFYEIQLFTRGLQIYNGIIQLISNVWYQFNEIRRDAVAWLRNRIHELSSDLWRIYTDPIGFVRDRVRDADADLRAIVNTGSGWIRDKLGIHFPELPKLNAHPIGYIVNTVRDHLPGVGFLFIDHRQWLKETTANVLGVPLWFFDDPWGYIFQKVLDLLEMSFDRYRAQIYRMGEAILRRLWEGV